MLERARMERLPLRARHQSQLQPILKLLLRALEPEKPRLLRKKTDTPKARTALEVFRQLVKDLWLQQLAARFLVTTVESAIHSDEQLSPHVRQLVKLQ